MPTQDAFFLPTGGGQRYCLYSAPDGPPKAAFLYLHPFAEEMNKARRAVALQTRALVAAGHAVLQIDLLGCGDSSGDFGDATWSAWIEDILAAHGWLRARTGAPVWFWGLRAGCLLATAAAARLPDAGNFLFWHPFVSGQRALQQFLRLAAAADMIGAKRAGSATPRECLDRGEAVEVAGYLLHPDLAMGLDKASLAPPPQGGRLLWLDVVGSEADTPLPASAKLLPQWQAAGYALHHHSVVDQTFWQTVEIETAPRLRAETSARLTELA
ncbi:MAG: hydrolase 2, exosortase A system-associated [Rhodocyclaceae bacterium]|nr:hydrolase 2, exosortase A system-associated [Rhodocyclaceae bacterium]